MPRVQKASGKTRHDPLHIQLGEDELEAKYGKVTRPGKRRKSHADEEDEENGEVITRLTDWRSILLTTTCHCRSF